MKSCLHFLAGLLAVLAWGLAPTARAADAAAPPPGEPVIMPGALPADFAHIAPVYLEAPLVAVVTIEKAAKAGRAERKALPTDIARHVLSARIDAVIKASGPVASPLSFAVDLPRALPKPYSVLKGQTWLVFLRPPVQFDGRHNLIIGNAFMTASDSAQRLTRAIAADAAQAALAGYKVGRLTDYYVSDDFAPYSSRYQIFLGLRPDNAAMIELRAHDSDASRDEVRVQVGDTVAEGTLVKRGTVDSLILACGLPGTDDARLQSLAKFDFDAARRAYSRLLATLGPCPTAGAANP